MQPRNEPEAAPLDPDEAAAELDALVDAPAEALLELVALDELLPQAAISKVATPAAMVAPSAVRLTVVPPRN
jgi:hypothetical protein